MFAKKASVFEIHKAIVEAKGAYNPQFESVDTLKNVTTYQVRLSDRFHDIVDEIATRIEEAGNTNKCDPIIVVKNIPGALFEPPKQKPTDALIGGNHTLAAQVLATTRNPQVSKTVKVIKIDFDIIGDTVTLHELGVLLNKSEIIKRSNTESDVKELIEHAKRDHIDINNPEYKERLINITGLSARSIGRLISWAVKKETKQRIIEKKRVEVSKTNEEFRDWPEWELKDLVDKYEKDTGYSATFTSTLNAHKTFGQFLFSLAQKNCIRGKLFVFQKALDEQTSLAGKENLEQTLKHWGLQERITIEALPDRKVRTIK